LTKTARDIAAELLERSGHALETGDADLFATCFTIPKEMETFEGRRVLSSAEELEAAFREVCGYYAKAGVTSMVRHVVDAEFRTPSTIVSTHEARLLAGDQLIQQPFAVMSIIVADGDDWRIRHSQYAIIDSTDHNVALIGLENGAQPPSDGPEAENEQALTASL